MEPPFRDSRLPTGLVNELTIAADAFCEVRQIDPDSELGQLVKVAFTHGADAAIRWIEWHHHE